MRIIESIARNQARVSESCGIPCEIVEMRGIKHIPTCWSEIFRSVDKRHPRGWTEWVVFRTDGRITQGIDYNNFG